MLQFNIGGVSETIQDTSTAGYISAASTSDLLPIIVFDSTAGPPVEIKREVLPTSLQVNLNGCDSSNCKYVSYNFESQVVTEPISNSNLNHVLDLGPIVQVDSGIFLKETEKLPIIFSSLPAYDLKYTSYTGTPMETWMNFNGPQACANRCDQLGSSCEGFNFNQLTLQCTLFAPGTSTKYNDDLQSFKKADIKTSVVPHVSGTSYDFNRTGAGDKCRDAAACNSVLSNLVEEHIINKFTTNSIKACKYCPPRGFYRIGGDQAIITNEDGNSMLVNDIYNTMFNLQYNKTVISQNGCGPGTHRTAVGGMCQACDVTLPSNSAFRYLCQYKSCPANQTLTSIWGSNASLSRPYYVVYCTDSNRAYGHHEVDVTYSYSLTVSGVVYPQTFIEKETLPCAWGLISNLDAINPPPLGYKYDAGQCTYSSCGGLKWDSSQKIESAILDDEIYVADRPISRREYANQWGMNSDNTVTRREYTGDTGGTGGDAAVWRKVNFYSNPNYRIYAEHSGAHGCNVTRCPLNTVANSTHTQCDPCGVSLGNRDRRRYSTSCEICSVPLGSRWISVDWVLRGLRVTPIYPRSQCETTSCSTLPIDNQIWDSEGLDMCGIRECAVDQVPNADRTACITAPGVSSICDVYDCSAKCTTGSKISADGKSCTPCDPVSLGYDFAYGAPNACYAPKCSNTPASSNIYDYACSERTCFATTEPDANKTACVRCSTEPYISASGQRFGYISNAIGGSIWGSVDDPTIGGSPIKQSCSTPLGQCPVPTGLRRWRYDIGCDHIVCPRFPGANERWAGTFGCDIVTYTGSTACSVYPRAGNKWADTTSCTIVACPTMTTVQTCNQLGWGDLDATRCFMYKPSTGCPPGSTEITYAGYQMCTIPKPVPQPILGPSELWGPNCTKISLKFYQDSRNSANTYPIKCTTYPRLGQKYDGNTPCNVVACPLTPATGYIWDDNATREYGCQTKLCTDYTFPNMDRTKCIPCPSLAQSRGWYKTGTLCRVDACSNQVTIAKNQYWTDAYCSYSTCPTGYRVIDAFRVGAGGSYKYLYCAPCNVTTLTSQQYWSSPGASCNIVTCQGQTEVNAAKNGCEACSPMTPAPGYTFNGVNGCTPVQCPAIGSSNIWMTPGSCDTLVCDGWTRPNATRTACETCTLPVIGYTWASAVGCTTTACPAIASSNIFTKVGFCDSMACTGHTQPNASKTSCIACTPPTLGRQWASADGCATTACPAIAASNIFTIAGSCTSRKCVGLTQPNTDKTACEKCPTPTLGRQWASADGCATTACPAIAASNIFTIAGYCYETECMDNTTPNAARSACVACPRPSPGYDYVSTTGCSTQACTQSPAPGYYWEPLGGCILKPCEVVPGLNEFFTSGCSIETCATGTLRNPDGISCSDMICNPDNVYLPPNSIYIPSSDATASCTTVACTGHTRPDVSSMICEPCPSPTLGNVWASTNGCATTACPSIAASNIFTTAGSCASIACIGTTVPNSTKSECVECSRGHFRSNATNTACEACPAPSLGFQWASDDGCGVAACPAIPSNSIFTTVGNCNLYTACTGRTQPNATKSVCEACPSIPTWGYTWASDEGCAITACPAIAASNIFTTMGLCDNTACTGHKTPNGFRGVCIDCPRGGPGTTWVSSQGCEQRTCTLSDPNRDRKIWVEDSNGGVCGQSTCVQNNFRRPNADKTWCEPCPSPPPGMKIKSDPYTYSGTIRYSSTSWCDLEPCPAITSTSNIYTNPSTYSYFAAVCLEETCTGNTIPNSDHTACEECPEHTEPNAARTACNACPVPSLGNTWAMDMTTFTVFRGCDTMSCDTFTGDGTPYLFDNEIYTSEGLCAYTACTGRTRPDVTKTICEDCPPMTLAYGWTFVGAPDGCDPIPCSVASSNIFVTPGFCENIACTGHTTPNTDRSACVACPQLYGRYWTSTEGCSMTTCPAIAASNVYTAFASCNSVACTGHTRPNSTKTVCIECPITIGRYWTNTTGCTTSSCPAISSSNIFTTIGLCDNRACTGHTLPNATKSVCEACPTPSLGNTWASTDGCTVTACPAISSSNIFTSAGLCANEACTEHKVSDSTKTVCVYRNGDVQWIARISGSAKETISSIATDSSGLYVTGMYNSSPLTTYNKDGTAYGTTLPGITSDGYTFIVKYNTSGYVQWVARLTNQYPGVTGMHIEPTKIATDSSGLYVTGYLDNFGTIKAYNANGTVAKTLSTVGGSGSAYEAFIVKYNTSGTVQWLIRLGGSLLGTMQSGCSVTTDSSGVYVSGTYDAEKFVAYNSNGTAYATVLPAAYSGYKDGFIIKYNTSGTVQWVARVSGTSYAHDVIYASATDSTGLYLAGSYSSTSFTAYNSNGTAYGTTLTPSGYDVFIVKYNTSGTVQWLTRLSGTNIETIGPNGIVADSSGIYVTGLTTSTTMTAYNVGGTTYGSIPGGPLFIVKYNSSGIVQWMARIAGANIQTTLSNMDVVTSLGSISIDGTGIYVTGKTNGSITAYNRDGTAYGTSLSGPGFVVKYNTDGYVQWINRTSSEISSSTTDSSGAYVAGDFIDSSFNAYYRDGAAYETTVPFTSSTSGGIYGDSATDTFIVKYY